MRTLSKPWLLGATRAMQPLNGGLRALYRRGWLPSHRADVPVISVGNIAMGGTGKTPLVATVARILLNAGARPAILTRGHGRRSREPVLHLDPAVPRWQIMGDEPTMLALALPGVPIVVDADRVRGAATAVSAAAATHLLLDDGFQHWRLKRDLDLVVVSADDPLGDHSLRREHPRALAAADAILAARCTGPDQAAAVRALLARWAPGVPVECSRLEPTALHRDGAVLTPRVLAEERVVAVAAIGNPTGFVRTLRELGARMVDHCFLPDHSPISAARLARALASAEALAARVVLTAKDAVKLTPSQLRLVDWLEVEATLPDGALAGLLSPLLSGTGARCTHADRSTIPP